ncbi:hypothetical protein BDN72DRAFT_105078 [Pluteus cervinus]|uniref:Uncharacterized protein n=1 Tax=Pluteus cervinus TaxID=181527 RepID=A0ACD3APB1_9AGAR|nr:hypothetical protein BDN72DRAFT_105078 [Pluteus cervinus]
MIIAMTSCHLRLFCLPFLIVIVQLGRVLDYESHLPSFFSSHPAFFVDIVWTVLSLALFYSSSSHLSLSGFSNDSTTACDVLQGSYTVHSYSILCIPKVPFGSTHFHPPSYLNPFSSRFLSSLLPHHHCQYHPILHLYPIQYVHLFFFFFSPPPDYYNSQCVICVCVFGFVLYILIFHHSLLLFPSLSDWHGRCDCQLRRLELVCLDIDLDVIVCSLLFHLSVGFVNCELFLDGQLDWYIQTTILPLL